MRQPLLWSACLALTVFTGCSAPGKPKGEEQNPESSMEFATLYNTNCSGCHGAEGKYGPGRILNDSLYLAFISRVELKNVLINGRPGTSMPAWARSHGGPLSDQQIDVLVNGIYDRWARPFQAKAPLPAYSASIENADVAHGKKLFAKDCYLCHGPGARVGLVSSASYLQLVSNQMLRTSIVVGRSDLGMPNYQVLNAGKPLADADVTDLVAYLASLRPGLAPGEGMYTKTQVPGNGDAVGSSGSGNGPGSPTQTRNEGHKQGNSSQSGGTIESANPSKEKK